MKWSRRTPSRASRSRSRVPTLQERASGVLLHVTSLPGPHGNGDLGAEAHAFAEMLARSGQRWWQMLPVGPEDYGDSPYSAISAFAGNPLLVDLDALGVPVDRARFAMDAVDYAPLRKREPAALERRLLGCSRAYGRAPETKTP